jgi:hypothetical protein
MPVFEALADPPRLRVVVPEGEPGTIAWSLAAMDENLASLRDPTLP